jgi:hypothetical protein
VIGGTTGAADANPPAAAPPDATLLDVTLLTATPFDVTVCVETEVWLDHDPETAGT